MEVHLGSVEFFIRQVSKPHNDILKDSEGRKDMKIDNCNYFCHFPFNSEMCPNTD